MGTKWGHMAELKIRLPDEEKEAVEAAALAVEESVTKWARRALRAAVPKSLRRPGLVEEPEIPVASPSTPRYIPPKAEKVHSSMVARQREPGPDVSTLGPLCDKGCGCYGGIRSIQCKMGWNCPCHGKGTPGVCGFCGSEGEQKHRLNCPNREG